MAFNPSSSSGANGRNSCQTSERFVDCIAASRRAEFDEETLAVAKTFLVDTLAVGVAGTANPASDKVLQTAFAWGVTVIAEYWGDLAFKCRLCRQPSSTAFKFIVWNGMHYMNRL
jgi:hypothetical protein